MRTRVALVAIILAALVAPAPAAASVVADLSAALRIAEAHWGGPPSCGAVSVAAVPDLRAPAGVERPEGSPVGGLAYPWECRFEYTLGLHDVGFGALCVLVVHEVGHIHGRGHTDDPADVMYGGDALPAAVPGCIQEVDRRERLAVLAPYARRKRERCLDLRRAASHHPRRRPAYLRRATRCGRYVSSIHARIDALTAAAP